MRTEEFQVDRALRGKLPERFPRMWEDWHAKLFCNYWETVEAYLEDKHPDYEGETQFVDNVEELILDHKEVLDEMKFTDEMYCNQSGHVWSTMARLAQAQLYLEQIKKELAAQPENTVAYGEDMVLKIQIQMFIDMHLLHVNYIMYHRPPQSLCAAGTDEYGEMDTMYEQDPEFYKVVPHWQRVPWIGQLPDLSGMLLGHGDVFRVRRPAGKSVAAMMIHIFLCKTQLHHCQNRNLPQILMQAAEQNEQILDMIRDIIMLVLLGNYHTAKVTPGFTTRVFLVSNFMLMARMKSFDLCMWMMNNERLVYFCLKEYMLLLLDRVPSMRTWLFSFYRYGDYTQIIHDSMDHIRGQLETCIDWSTGMPQVLEEKLDMADQNCEISSMTEAPDDVQAILKKVLPDTVLAELEECPDALTQLVGDIKRDGIYDPTESEEMASMVAASGAYWELTVENRGGQEALALARSAVQKHLPKVMSGNNNSSTYIENLAARGRAAHDLDPSKSVKQWINEFAICLRKKETTPMMEQVRPERLAPRSVPDVSVYKLKEEVERDLLDMMRDLYDMEYEKKKKKEDHAEYLREQRVKLEEWRETEEEEIALRYQEDGDAWGSDDSVDEEVSEYKKEMKKKELKELRKEYLAKKKALDFEEEEEEEEQQEEEEDEKGDWILERIQDSIVCRYYRAKAEECLEFSTYRQLNGTMNRVHRLMMNFTDYLDERHAEANAFITKLRKMDFVRKLASEMTKHLNNVERIIAGGLENYRAEWYAYKEAGASESNMPKELVEAVKVTMPGLRHPGYDKFLPKAPGCPHPVLTEEEIECISLMAEVAAKDTSGWFHVELLQVMDMPPKFTSMLFTIYASYEGSNGSDHSIAASLAQLFKEFPRHFVITHAWVTKIVEISRFHVDTLSASVTHHQYEAVRKRYEMKPGDKRIEDICTLFYCRGCHRIFNTLSIPNDSNICSQAIGMRPGVTGCVIDPWLNDVVCGNGTTPLCSQPLARIPGLGRSISTPQGRFQLCCRCGGWSKYEHLRMTTEGMVCGCELPAIPLDSTTPKLGPGYNQSSIFQDYMEALHSQWVEPHNVTQLPKCFYCDQTIKTGGMEIILHDRKTRDPTQVLRSAHVCSSHAWGVEKYWRSLKKERGSTCVADRLRKYVNAQDAYYNRLYPTFNNALQDVIETEGGLE